MTLWRITAPDTDGREYVYEVDGVGSADDAAWEVYGHHGRLFREGVVSHILGLPYEVEELS